MINAGGVARVPDVELVAELTFPGLMSTPARVDRVEKFAGAAIGSAVVCWPVPPAQKALVGFGKRASIKVGGTYIFRGTVGTSPVYVSAQRDQVEAVLYDDKWGMQRLVVGQSGIGTVDGDGKGFNDVGFDIVINRDGRPNKLSDALDFTSGSSAQYWTLAQAMQFVFAYYIDPNVATLGSLGDDEAWERSPSHLVLSGMNGLQAVDTICQLAGRSWGLKAGASASRFVVVRPAPTDRSTVFFFSPLGNRVVEEAGEWHADVATIQGSILHARDRHQCRSAPMVVETTITSEGETPLLKKTTFKDKQFAARFASDPTMYSANGLGANLAATARPKAWLSALVTRMSGASGYVPAASMASHLDDPRVEIPVWVALGSGKPFMRAVGGYEVDYANALIDFESNVEFVMPRRADGTLKWEKVALPVDWSQAVVRATVAVVLERGLFAESADTSSYLPDPFYVVIDKPDLVPEFRYKSKLPNLATTPPNDVVTFAEEARETYVDVTQRMAEAVAASMQSMPSVETPITVEFPLFPLAEIGDALIVSGRNLGATGDEVIISVRYDVHNAYRTEVEATNVTAAINPDRFIRK